MGKERVDFSRLARDRLEAAQAAIAAAEKSAMESYSSFNDAPVAPWVASAVKETSSFAERLQKHEARLNSIKNAIPVQFADARAYHTSAPADSHTQDKKPLNHLQLPPWSQPVQLPSFSTFQKSGAYVPCDLLSILLSSCFFTSVPTAASLQIRLQAKQAWKDPAGCQQQDQE
jgi:hypothetical protein